MEETRILDYIKTIHLQSLPELFNGGDELFPEGSGWCRKSTNGKWAYRPKNSAIVKNIFERFKVSAALEIGVCFGHGLNILRHHGGDDILLVGVDTMEKPKKLIEAGYKFDIPVSSRNTVIIEGRSKDAFGKVQRVLSKNKIAGFDLIVIDADHSYQGAMTDLLLYSQLLSARGVIYFDDATHNDVVRELLYVPRLRKRFEVFGFGLELSPEYDACWIGLKPGSEPVPMMIHWRARELLKRIVFRLL